MKISCVIKEKISESGVPISHLSKKTGIEYRQLYNEVNDISTMKADTLISLCNCLKINLNELIAKNKTPNSDINKPENKKEEIFLL